MSTVTHTIDAKPAAGFQRRFYITAWRWHFYAGLYVAPFLAMLAVTGLIMLWSSVLAGRDGENLYSVAPLSQTLAVSQQAQAALAVVPDGVLKQYIAPRTDDQAALFRVNSGSQSIMVAVDPYRGVALGQWQRRTALYDLADTIHGTLLIGTLGDRLIEIAAGFAVMLVVTGLYLWWPRDTGWRSVLVPQLATRGRALWKSLHMTVGFYASIILLAFLLSGLTWAGIWGEKFTQAWSTFPAEKWDNVPLSDATHASMNHDGVKNVPWALEQTPMPASGSSAGVTGIAQGHPVDLDGVVALARRLGFDQRFQLSFPGGETGVWTIARDTMSNDSSDPLSDRTVHVDRYTGRILADIGFADYGVAGKAMAVGVALHEGDMGVWNIALNTLFCLSILFLSVSGVVMWWKRRPRRAGLRLMAPTVTEPGPLWKGGALVMLALSVLFPLSGAVLVTVIAADLLILRHLKPLKRAIG
ncbi:PepSY-associated TM helix domain-containing protein [Rhizobium sp. SGZ-381]|uniref:PepSY-associated TM helix domain-containing protein n=1 Tax=Rhizobium sp. SGZ-381 TaxID=3342800 RepID=UPI00367277A9